MDTLKIVCIGIIAVFCAMTVRAYKPEFGVLTALTAAVLLLSLSVPALKSIVDSVNTLSKKAAIDGSYIKTVVKIIGVAYITQFASELAKDAGEGLLSKKLELVGKIGITAIILPVLISLIDVIIASLSAI